MSEIEEFYADKSLFLTGGTGFLGKILIEKLLRSCSRIKKIYVLIRPNSSNCPQKRLNELFNCEVFKKIKENSPHLLSKVEPICGNITFPCLGISYECLTKLKREVNIVLHSAATIRFDEPLKKALEINLCGTEGVINFCNQLDNLISFVHISTAYCNTIKNDIEEKVYEHNVSVENILSANRWMDADLLESLSEKLYCGRPSSYHYTKALAESLVLHNAQNLKKKFNKTYKTAIIRPSIVTPTYNEPIPGYTNNYYGPTGYLVVCGKGVLRSMIVHKDKICDIVPVDIVANTVIAAAFYIVKQNLTSNSLLNKTDEQNEIHKLTNSPTLEIISNNQINGHFKDKSKSQQTNGKLSMNGDNSENENYEEADAALDAANDYKLTNGHHLKNEQLTYGKITNGHFKKSTNEKLINDKLHNSDLLSNGKSINPLNVDHKPIKENNDLVNGSNTIYKSSNLNENSDSIIPQVPKISFRKLMNDESSMNKTEQEITVFNCVSGNLNAISWGEIHSLSEPFLLKYPSIELFRYPGALLHSNKMLHQIILQLEHNIPAMLIDFVFKLLGHKPILTPVYDKVHRSIEALEHFTTNEWTWKTDNFETLINSLNEVDKEKFFIDIRRLNWKNYMENYILGVRYYLLREDPSTIPNARKKLKRLYYLTQIVKLGIAGGIIHQGITRYPMLKKYLLWISSKRIQIH